MSVPSPARTRPFLSFCAMISQRVLSLSMTCEAATVIFTLSGPWNKSVTKKADSFAVCFLNLFVGGLALFVLGTVMGGRLHVQGALAVLVMLYLAFICAAAAAMVADGADEHTCEADGAAQGLGGGHAVRIAVNKVGKDDS